MKKIFLILCLVSFLGCQTVDITEPIETEKPKPIDYAKKYPDAIEAVKFRKDFLANQKEYIGKKVQIIGNLDRVKDLEDKDGKLEKRIYMVAEDRTYPVGCILEKDIEMIAKRKKRVIEGTVFEGSELYIHLKPCKILD